MAFKKIRLTANGDCLVPVHDDKQSTDENVIGQISLTRMMFEDPRRMSSRRYPNELKVLGDHEVCGGSFQLRTTTASTQILLCGECYLRVEFPRTVKTYGQLREHLEK